MVKLQVPHFQPKAMIKARDLAEWLNGHPDEWWRVDGEAGLTEQVDFPCPGDELAEALRGVWDRTLEILGDTPVASPAPEVGADRFESFADRNNRYSGRNFLLRWQGERAMWLLSEDVPATESARSED